MRIRRWIAGTITLLATIVALALVLVDTGWGCTNSSSWMTD